MDESERYRLTHELFMLWRMRYEVGGPFGLHHDNYNREIIKREIDIARRLGGKHNLDYSGDSGNG